METLPDFATVADLSAFWRPMNSTEESDRAETLLHIVSSYLRQVAKNNGIDIDEKIEDDPSDIYKDSVKMVVMSGVKRAMNTPVDAPPADQWSQAATPYSESMTLTNPGGDLFFKNNELQLLGLSSIAGKSKIGLLRGVRGGL